MMLVVTRVFCNLFSNGSYCVCSAAWGGMLLPDQTYEVKTSRGGGTGSPLLALLHARQLPPDFFCANRHSRDTHAPLNNATMLPVRYIVS